jgi:dihydroxyacetone kinase-like protein
MKLTKIEKKDLIDLLRSVFQFMIEKQEEIGGLDAAIGDGDLGVTIQLGYRAALRVLDNAEALDMQKILNAVALEISENAASTFGILQYSMFFKASQAIKGIDRIGPVEAAAMLTAAIEGVQKKGKAVLGDKTVLDAMIPAGEALQRAAAQGQDLSECLRLTLEAAKKGAENTILLKSKAGRSSYFSDRTIGTMDPGAFAFVVFLEGIQAFFDGRE